MATEFDVIVIGAGQAGLAAGYYLQKANARFSLFDSGRAVGESWIRRWDSLKRPEDTTAFQASHFLAPPMRCRAKTTSPRICKSMPRDSICPCVSACRSRRCSAKPMRSLCTPAREH